MEKPAYPSAHLAKTANLPAASPKADLKRLIYRLAIFGMPYIGLLGFPAAFLYLAGELEPVDAQIREQIAANRPTLIGPAYTNPDKYFKLEGTVARRPEVIALGASRVMQFREEFFLEGVNFYNAGGGVERIRHLRIFLNGIPAGKEPKLILLGLEQCFFNPNWDNLVPDEVESQYKTFPDPFQIISSSFGDFYLDYFHGKVDLGRILKKHADGDRTGLGAVMNDNGFRNDGSYNMGEIIRDPDNPSRDDYQFRNTLDRIRRGAERFEPSSVISPAALAELNAFLDECKKRNITVTGFLPPFAPTVFAKLRSEGSRYRYLFELGDELAPRFAARGYYFHDFSDIGPLGYTDPEFFDGYHGSEKVNLSMFLVLLREDAKLAPYADAERLKGKLGSAKARHIVF